MKDADALKFKNTVYFLENTVCRIFAPIVRSVAFRAQYWGCDEIFLDDSYKM